MLMLPADLTKKFNELLIGKTFSNEFRASYVKRLRFYWDFCNKYQYEPYSSESLPCFLQKLVEKRQSAVMNCKPSGAEVCPLVAIQVFGWLPVRMSAKRQAALEADGAARQMKGCRKLRLPAPPPCQVKPCCGRSHYGCAKATAAQCLINCSILFK